MKYLTGFLLLFSFTIALFADEKATTDAASTPEPTPEQIAFFETKVRPVLVEHCFKCHGDGKHKGNLQLDSRSHLMSGGDSGAAIIPGHPADSLLIQAINYDGYEMPPGQKLPEQKIADLTRWVEMGAPWPGSDGEVVAAVRKAGTITDEDRDWWSFHPITSPPVPELKQSPAPDNAIDAFILATLEEKHLTPNGSASARTLIRRAFFDLIGLPPSPEEMAQWLPALQQADGRINQVAWARLIDDLLARPQYGERWGRHWLDVVRFAQTNGYEFDKEKKYAWRYRDYVIDAFNSDKPYDRFVIEQLAGDEIPDANAESRIATGFYRLGLWDFEPDDAQQSEFDDLDDIMVTSSAAFLGLTMGCARCHDHKFDPILHKDYYSLLAYFRNVRKYNYPDESPENPGLLPISSPEKVQEALQNREKRRAELDKKIAETADQKEKEKLQKQRGDSNVPGLEWAMAVREFGPEAKSTHILIRGNAQTPGDEVQPAIPQVLGGGQPEIVLPHQAAPFQTTGRRQALANWFVSDENPLTARVMVNRVWHYHFGRGIVPTTSDFGKIGALPSHPALLDWLAASFRSQGWSVKQLHRQIMLSQTYQRSSDDRNPSATAMDPANALLWRQNLHRLDAEVIRDSILAVAGSLNMEMGGRGFFPLVGEEVLSGGTIPGVGWESSSDSQRHRRSMYTFIKRSLVSPQLDIFDYANTALPLTERPTTTVAPQALTLLNDMFMQQQADAFASRVAATSGTDPESRIIRAYELALNRAPTPKELNVLRAYMEQQRGEFAALRTRLMFRPIVPVSLHPDYLRPLSVNEFVEGPEVGWTPLRGKWSNGGSLDTRQGPCSLWNGAIFSDARITATVTLGNASHLAGILLAANESDNFIKGYEVLLDPQSSQLSVIRHGGEPQTLGQVPAVIPAGVPLRIFCELQQGKLLVRLALPQSNVELAVTDPNPLQVPGKLGVRMWGAAVTLDDLVFETNDQRFDVATAAVGRESATATAMHWQAFGGQWTVGMDGVIKTAQPDAGGKIIWNDVSFSDGIIEADVRVLGAGDAGIVVRVENPQPGVDALTGYNINVSKNAIRLGKHHNNWTALASAKQPFSAEQWTHIRAVFEGARIRIYVAGQSEPAIDYTDPQPVPAGRIGFRTFNCPVEFRNVTVISSTFNGPVDLDSISPTSTVQLNVTGTKADDTEQRALESLCLLVLNLNEMIYVE